MNTVPVLPRLLGHCRIARLAFGFVFCVMTQEPHRCQLRACVARALVKTSRKNSFSAAVHTRNGVADNVAKDETDAFTQIRKFLSYTRNAGNYTR